jgi:Domain of unknown function (DUF4440)
MQRTSIFTCTLLVMLAASASADDKDDLIALDKQWGASATKGDMTAAAKFLADELVSVTEKGVRGKKEELADNEPAPAGTTYKPTDFKVTFINRDTAIMTHGTEGKDAHHSLHVWTRKGDTWQVAATSTTPEASE